MTEERLCTVLHEAGIQSPDWIKIAKPLGVDSIVLPAAFFNQWSADSDDCQPSWKALAKALEKSQDQKYKQAAIRIQHMKGNHNGYTVLVELEIKATVTFHYHWAALKVHL